MKSIVMKRMVIFASGSGSNAENIIRYFQKNTFIKVTHVLSNKKDAKVLKRAKRLNIPNSFFNKEAFSSEDKLLKFLKKEADYIILAGFLWRIPAFMVAAFPNKIMNIHPALLPNYGGKGMYGMHIHKAVVANKEKETGITIHYVNENYDEGAIIFQKSFPIKPTDTPEKVAEKIHLLEYTYFPQVLEQVMKEGE